MKHKLISILLIILCLGCTSKSDLPISITIDDWQFKKATDSVWLTATVPGNVHSDLMDNELIEHPFIGDNEGQLLWISETDWEYRTKLLIDEKTLQKKQTELKFEGLDTYASVFLNDSLIINTNNAFRNYSVDVKSCLKETNELRILFENTTKIEKQEKAKLNYTLPEGNRIFSRKAQFQYGWDWGPKLNTSGIWRPISLKSWNDISIDDVFVETNKLNDSIAILTSHLTYRSSTDEEFHLDIYVNNDLNATFQMDSSKSFAFQITNPKRWWPHNLGDPFLYDFKFVIRDGPKLLDSLSMKKGLRTVALVSEKDSIGESFYFKVNDVPVYVKGANYIPQNSLQNKVTDALYEKLLDDVVDANMNMLRVWGGGIYENDIFYDLCDEKGILVWQDFMFACAMYPGDVEFLENVRLEAEDNVKRLRNHASIALWCGNNENSEGWHRWGWQDGRSEDEKNEIWNDYLKVFDSILPGTVASLTETDYWESSPKYGRGNSKYKSEGDAHDWWIWHDAYPFEHLEKNVPRFMSEFGFQSFPGYEVINYINQNDSLDITSEEFKNHQKHSRGFDLIEAYMKRDFPVPKRPEDYVYMSQILQAYGIIKGVEAQRRSKPYNMGSLYWQLNDCWPAISWSSIDFFGNWKALHYKIKNSFENILISTKVEENNLKTYLINDNLNSKSGDLSIEILDFEGKSHWKFIKNIITQKEVKTIIHELDLYKLPVKINELVVVSKFDSKTYLAYLAKPKDLKLKNEEIKIKIDRFNGGFQIELYSKTLQKDVFLFSNEKGHFSDNFFDMLADETKTIYFETQSSELNDLRIKTFNSLIR